MKFTIDRSTWRCGGDNPLTMRGKGKTRLLNHEGYLCCLGQIALQCEIKKPHIIGADFPSDVKFPNEIYKELFIVSRCYNNNFANKAIRINDNEDFSDSTREEKLKELFEDNGIELKFINKYETNSFDQQRNL